MNVTSLQNNNSEKPAEDNDTLEAASSEKLPGADDPLKILKLRRCKGIYIDILRERLLETVPLTLESVQNDFEMAFRRRLFNEF